MSIVSIDDIKQHANISSDADDGLLEKKIRAAEQWIEAFIGSPLADFTPPPGPLQEAVRQLVAHLYENREATLVGVEMSAVSPGLFDLLAPYREWTF